MQENRSKEIEISKHSQEIFSEIPTWLLKSGMMMLAGFIGLAFFVAWFVQFPDTFRTPVTILNKYPSITLEAPRNGYIQNFLVKDKEKVAKGDLIALLEHEGEFQSILALQKLLPEIQTALNTQQSKHLKSLLQQTAAPNLGSLTAVYQDFVQHSQVALAKGNKAKKPGHFSRLASQVELLQEKDTLLNSQHEALKKALASLKKQISSTVQNTRSTAYAELRQRYEALEAQFKQSSIDIIDSKLALLKAQEDITDNEMWVQNTHSDAWQKAAFSLGALETQLENWMSQHTLRSPIDGQVAMNRDWVTLDRVESGQALANIMPTEQEIIARIPLNDYPSAKVAEGQKVIIKLFKYPDQEYGHLEGTLSKIPSLSRNDALYLEVSLDKGLTTSYGKTLSYQEGLAGEAKIITKDSRLLYRFISI